MHLQKSSNVGQRNFGPKRQEVVLRTEVGVNLEKAPKDTLFSTPVVAW